MKIVTLEIEAFFLEITHLLAQYDPVLKEHFQYSPRNATYVSNTIQNELIAALYYNMIEELKKEFQAATCFSIMKQVTQYIKNKCQLL